MDDQYAAAFDKSDKPVERRKAMTQIVLILLFGVMAVVACTHALVYEARATNRLAFSNQPAVPCQVHYKVVGAKDAQDIAREIGGDPASIEKQIYNQVIAIREDDEYVLRVACDRVVQAPSSSLLPTPVATDPPADDSS